MKVASKALQLENPPDGAGGDGREGCYFVGCAALTFFAEFVVCGDATGATHARSG